MADDAPLGIIMRCNTLADTYRSPLDEMKAKSAELQSLREDQANRVLAVNSRLADHYEEHGINDEIDQQNNQNFYQDIKQIRNVLVG
ncbi:unnamed protein product [Rodentolepis nana]|uniref:Na+/H+ antiporter n=1 Tax=Rodentolepis nana TaxID=102285 RepID=A0A0R3TCD1_RODNA|nr:unnamed protein product [Rodentolepis nana]